MDYKFGLPVEIIFKCGAVKNINKVIKDCSLQFCFQYVFRSVHNRVENGHELSLHHILLDLTKNRS